MLISHRKKFIFTKTGKTAGTSVESYFEKDCMPEGDWQESHTRDEYVSEFGIIGYRGESLKKDSCKWYNHMSAKKIRQQIGEDIWNSYYKFTVIRNPFDKLISSFYYDNRNGRKQKRNYSYSQKLKSWVKSLLGKTSPTSKIQKAQENSDIEYFRHWLIETKGNKSKPGDRDRYLINGEECIDYFIRFENLFEGINHVCNQLSIPFEPSRLPKFKMGIRNNIIPVRDYYDHETEKIVRKLFSYEINRFGYDIPE